MWKGQKMPLKSNLLLYMIGAWVITRTDIDGCVLCGKKGKSDFYVVRFAYYDYPSLTLRESTFLLCIPCFESRIKEIPIENLNNFIPLLKMKGKLVFQEEKSNMKVDNILVKMVYAYAEYRNCDTNLIDYYMGLPEKEIRRHIRKLRKYNKCL